MMELSPRQELNGYTFAVVKSFLIWSFTLLVCFLVVGFPLVVILMTVGGLATLVLQSVLPISSVLLVAGSMVGGMLLSIFAAAALLTLKGIHPQDVRWLTWLHGEGEVASSTVYAACPLTCDISSMGTV